MIEGLLILFPVFPTSAYCISLHVIAYTAIDIVTDIQSIKC